jgi:hypothetical protein
MDASSIPVALLLPSIVGTFIMIVGLLAVLIPWMDKTEKNLRKWRTYRRNRKEIEQKYLIYRMHDQTNQARKLVSWLRQEEPLLKWHELGVLIPVQKSLLLSLDMVIGTEQFLGREPRKRLGSPGQVLVLFLPVLVVALAILALVLDGGMYMWHWQSLQANLDASCLAAASGSGTADYVESLNANDVPPEYYAPYEFEVRGIQATFDGYRAWLSGPHDTYLAHFMGISTMNIHVQTRCLSSLHRVLPIAVQEPWVLEGFGTPTEYLILGDGAECVECQGADFAGAVIPQVWCMDTNCDPKHFFGSADESNSPNVFKSLYRDTIHGTEGSPLVPIGGRVPQISGVSNRFLVQAVEDAGYVPGDQIIVMVYNGTIDQPEPSYGNWENLEVIYYALATISRFDPNTLYVTFDEKIDSLEAVHAMTRSRQIPYDWSAP